jgi:deazaflavin-dependent oxidoreductase (nitroreductase family)
MTPFQERLGRWTVQLMTAWNNTVFELSGGQVAGNVPSGRPICLVTTVGRRSGRRRTVPLFAHPRGEELVLVASNGGMSGPPAWYLNLVATPEVEVQERGRRRAMVARVAAEAERAELWPQLLAGYEHFAAYQARTSRRIPLVVLTPRTPPPAP